MNVNEVVVVVEVVVEVVIVVVVLELVVVRVWCIWCMVYKNELNIMNPSSLNPECVRTNIQKNYLVFSAGSVSLLRETLGNF